MDTGHLIIAGLIIWFFYHVVKGYNEAGTGSNQLICPACGTQTDAAMTKTKGSTGIELILWLCFIIPGLIYSIWRMNSKYDVCPACKQPGMIPLNSPNGQRLAAHFAESPQNARQNS